jgi:hypothetical protein
MANFVKKLQTFNLDTITANQAPKSMGKAKFVYLDSSNKFISPKLVQAWPVRPTDDKNEKFNLELRLDTSDPDTEHFKAALQNLDLRVRKLAFEHRKAWFGKLIDDSEIQSESDMRRFQYGSIKKGGERPDGSSYDDTIRFQVRGWSNQLNEVIYKGEGDSKYAVDTKWNSRLVDAQGHGGPDDSQSKFYINEGRDMTTSKEQMAPWTPCQDPAGNQIKDGHGNTVWEFVGPKHCKPGCKLAVVFQPSMVWIAGGKFGLSLHAKQVFITPPPKKPSDQFEDMVIVPRVDPISAMDAAREILNMEGDLDTIPPEKHEEVVEEVVAPVVTASQESGTKRAAEKTVEKKASKKSKTVTVDEDF